MIELIGLSISIIGTLISIYGVIRNNLYHDHRDAMMWWMISNPLLLIYFIGQTLHWWNGTIPALCMSILYAVFTVTNWYGLVKT